MRFDLFLISFLTLFLELTCIRWFPSHVLFLTFFTNTVLLASILGISVGCLAANRKSNLLLWTPLILMIGARQRAFRRMAAADLGERDRRRQPGVAANGVLRRRVPGARSVELRDSDRSDLRLLLPGHRAGDDGARTAAGTRAGADPNRLEAYTIDIVGSIAGIVVFAACSFLELPPTWWFALRDGRLRLVPRAGQPAAWHALALGRRWR